MKDAKSALAEAKKAFCSESEKEKNKYRWG
jgi:hypothetical protein